MLIWALYVGTLFCCEFTNCWVFYQFLCPSEEDQEKQSSGDVTDVSGAQQTNKESEPGTVEALCESVNEPEQVEVLCDSVRNQNWWLIAESDWSGTTLYIIHGGEYRAVPFL